MGDTFSGLDFFLILVPLLNVGILFLGAYIYGQK